MASVPVLRLGRRLVRLSAVLLLVAGITFCDTRLLHVNSATAAFTFLLLVLGLAARGGLEESITASVASMFCYNYFFLPPVGALTISDPENWVALAAFLITAITASQLSSSAQRRADEASAQRLEMERVYRFSRGLMLGTPGESVPSRILQSVAEVFAVPHLAFWEPESRQVSRVGDEAGTALTETRLQHVARSGEIWRDEEAAAIVPLTLGGQRLGSLGVAGASLSPVALSAVAQLAAIALERARAQAVASRAEATRENEALKSTLLDALAHEFKTPLTSIKAAISSVLSTPSHDPVELELLTVVDEEVDRLTSLVTESIDMARIGTGQVRLHCEPLSIPELIGSTLFRLRSMTDGRTISVDLQEALPPVEVDSELCGLALRQLVTNSLKYAPTSAAIEITGAAVEGGFVQLRVCNDGPPIPPAEQESIFEKFYRGRDVKDRITGTGLGLTIAREIVQAHGGRIWVESAPAQKTCFAFTLPVAENVGVGER